MQRFTAIAAQVAPSRPKAAGEKKRPVPFFAFIRDDSLVMATSDFGLPADWQSNEAATQAFGLAWLESMASLGLWVPSLIEPSEMNLLINPAHADFGRVLLKIERYPFRFDPRLF